MRRIFPKSVNLAVLAALVLAQAAPLASAQEPAKAKAVREEMKRPVAPPQAADLEQALESNEDEKALDSYATRLVTHVWKEPKARYLVGGIVLGEVFLAGMLWKRMALNRAMWENQIRTVAGVAKEMGPTTAAYAKAEHDLLRAFAALEQADRAALAQNLNQFGPHTKQMMQRALVPANPAKPAFNATGALDIESATKNLEKAYGDWHQKAMTQMPTLKAAGTGTAPLATPQPLAEVTMAADQRLRAITRLDYANGQFRQFKDANLTQIAKQSGANLGQNLSWKGKVWRKARTGILLAAIPLFAVGISAYYDAEHERNQRLADLNEASLQDRNKWVNTLVPYFHRPLLYAVVKSWHTVQARAKSPLKRFTCPYELREAEVDNPHLQIMQSLAMATMLEMEQAKEDILEENGRKTIVISPRFFRRLFRKIVESEGTALRHLAPEALNPIIEDLADEAYHAFDRMEVAKPAEDGKNPGATFRFK